MKMNKTEYNHHFIQFNNGEISGLFRWDRAEFKQTVVDGVTTDEKIVVRKNYTHTNKKDLSKIWHMTVNRETLDCPMCNHIVKTSRQEFTHAQSDFWGDGKSFFIVHVICVLRKCGLVVSGWFGKLVFQVSVAVLINIVFIIWLVNSKYWCY
ncbi:MAG: hypothetical protein GY820_38645 [Gammaproteobacteria bacterium]|nr:hypothetical protein [Gammaproteobacteria bacterium]